MRSISPNQTAGQDTLKALWMTTHPTRGGWGIQAAQSTLSGVRVGSGEAPNNNSLLWTVAQLSPLTDAETEVQRGRMTSSRLCHVGTPMELEPRLPSPQFSLPSIRLSAATSSRRPLLPYGDLHTPGAPHLETWPSPDTLPV